MCLPIILLILVGVELPFRVVVTILECCVTFSGVKLSIRSFVLLSEDLFSILTILYTYNLHTSSNHGSPIVLCCPTRRVMPMYRRLVFVTRRLMLMSRRLVFVTRRVQKCSYIKFSKSLIFVSSSQSPTGIFFPQSIHLCYIGVL